MQMNHDVETSTTTATLISLPIGGYSLANAAELRTSTDITKN